MFDQTPPEVEAESEVNTEDEAYLPKPEIPELEKEVEPLPEMLPLMMEPPTIILPKRSAHRDIQLRWLVDDFEGLTDSVYEAVMVAATRARQVGRRQKLEIDTYNASLEIVEINPEEDEGEEAGLDRFHHSKPTVQALFELKRRRFKFRYPEPESK
ncbi:MAG: DNA-directed RNA polymerase subunit omega [Calditrichota bacterium]